jgi:hypothetical protein
MHDQESSTAENAASWFQNPDCLGSAHLCIDDKECFRCLANAAIPWGARSAEKLSANYHGFHIEQAGFAKWSAVIWKSHLGTLKRAAWRTAVHLHKFDLPPVFLTAAMLEAGARAGARRKGVTTHNEITWASKKLEPWNASAFDHTDPGRFWPRRLFMSLVKTYYKEMTP